MTTVVWAFNREADLAFYTAQITDLNLEIFVSFLREV